MSLSRALRFLFRFSQKYRTPTGLSTNPHAISKVCCNCIVTMAVTVYNPHNESRFFHANELFCLCDLLAHSAEARAPRLRFALDGGAEIEDLAHIFLEYI